MHKLKITICAYDAPGNIDGPTSWMKRLLPYLRNNGIETRIIFFAVKSKLLPAYNHFVKAGFACKIIYNHEYNEQQIKLLLEDINQYPPDIFIPNYFPVACYAAQWVKRSGIPTVAILHNDDAMHVKLVEVFAQNSDGSSLSAIVGVSKILTDHIHAFNLTYTRVECLPYGAPVSKEQSARHENENLKLVYVGRMLEKQKRISDVTKALCRVVTEIPGTECILYGSGKDLPNVLKILKNKGKGFAISYGGNLETSQVQAHLLKNHIFILLSDYEGLPIALMEAMGCGLVPVCSNMRSGIKELVTHNETGFIVNDRNDDFVNTIKKLKADQALWQNVSDKAREKMVTGYSDEICNNRWIVFLKELAGDKKSFTGITLPTHSELQSLTYPSEFKMLSNPEPSSILKPLFKIKNWAARFKRKVLN